MNIKEQLIQECLNIIKRKDVKDELKMLVKPMIELLLNELYPYIYIIITFVVLSFLLMSANFFIILRQKKMFL
jgi:hypothetical protein